MFLPLLDAFRESLVILLEHLDVGLQCLSLVFVKLLVSLLSLLKQFYLLLQFKHLELVVLDFIKMKPGSVILSSLRLFVSERLSSSVLSSLIFCLRILGLKGAVFWLVRSFDGRDATDLVLD